MLIRQLMALNEDALDDAQEDFVDRAVKMVDWSNLSYQEAIESVLSYIRKRDDDLFASTSNKKIRSMIEMRIPTLEADENTTEFEPRIIATATGFSVTETREEFVALTDDAGKVLATMPLLIWKELARSTTVG